MPTTPKGETTDYCYPDEVKGELECIGYMDAMDNFKQYHGYLEGRLTDDADSIYRCAVELFEKTKEATIHLMNRYDWDFHATLFRFLDTVQHFYTDDEAKLLEAYQRADRALAEIASRVDAFNDETCWLINSNHGVMLEFPDKVLKGGHDPSGFYCFTCDELFWKGQTRTLRIEDLMPTVLHLFDITMSGVLGRVAMELFRPTEPTSGISVEKRLRALKYID